MKLQIVGEAMDWKERLPEELRDLAWRKSTKTLYSCIYVAKADDGTLLVVDENPAVINRWRPDVAKAFAQGIAGGEFNDLFGIAGGEDGG